MCFSPFAGNGDSHRQQESEEGREPFQITLSCGVSRDDATVPALFRQFQKCSSAIPGDLGSNL